MKKLFVSVLICFTAFAAQANDDLEASMKIIGDQFKMIAKSLQTQNVTETDVASAQLMINEIKVSSLIYPDTATTEDLKKAYDKYMSELLVMAEELRDLMQTVVATEQPNFQPLVDKFVEINELRKEAHDEFKE